METLNPMPPAATDSESLSGSSESIGQRSTHLLYLHGFRSSPLSFKAQAMHAWLKQHRPDVVWWCPQLPPSPQAAMDTVEEGLKDWPASSAVMGSSLGGFYATLVAGRKGWPAVAINPVVHPARDLAKQIGQQTHWHSPEESFFFRPEYVEELRRLTPATLAFAERIASIVATGDEVLNWHEMAERYRQGPLRIVQGSDHALSDFDQHLSFILQHLNLQP